jgi:hypothetical protein
MAAPPSATEQLWLEMINRFRAQPQAELDLLTNYATPGTGTVFAPLSSSDPGVRLAISFCAHSSTPCRRRPRWRGTRISITPHRGTPTR